MTAVFQRPPPILDDPQDNQIRPQRRRRDSIEVIDVDELDDDIYHAHSGHESGASRPTQRRRLSMPSEIISLLDSDDEDLAISASNARPASRTRLQSPPPRNPTWGPVPPVPPVPHRYAGHTSFPMRRQPPTHPSPPVIRPSDQPFPFETSMRQLHPAHMSRPGPSNRPLQLHIPPRNSHFLPLRPLEPAPPSHHVPSMGLGGALITHNRARHQHQHPYRQHLPYEGGNSFLGRVGSGVRRILGGPALAPGDGPRNGINFLALGGNFDFLDDDDADRMLALQLLADGDGEGLRDLDSAFNPARAFIRSEVMRRRNNAREESPYRKEYTHPHPSETGFTFDFAPKTPMEVIEITSSPVHRKRIPSPDPIIIDEDDSSVSDAGPSTSASTIPASPSTPLSKTQFRPKTLPKFQTNATFLVCACCLDPLILGNNLTSEQQKDRRVWGLRCGHLIDGKCLKEIGRPHDTDPATVEPDIVGVTDRKGKGKARAIDMDDEDFFYSPGTQHEQDLEPVDNNNIRSRLRPRHVPTVSASSSSSPLPLPDKRGTRGRRAQQLPLPKYIWYCPVTGCGRLHASVKVNGDWIPEREDGVYGDSAGGGHGGRSSGRGRGRGAARRGRGRLAIPEILNDDSMSEGSSNNEGVRGAVPLFL